MSSIERARRLRRLTRGGLALALVVASTIVTSPSAVAEETLSCKINHDTQVITMKVQGDDAYAELSRDADGRFYMNGVLCDFKAYDIYTDTIKILGGPGHQEISLRLAKGGFEPGNSQERGSSDEIEITMLLGTGPDTVQIVGDKTPDHIRFGTISGPFATITKVNLNADEADGIDADLTIGVGFSGDIIVRGGGGGDVISAAGDLGTGDPLILPISIYGGIGADHLTGGNASDALVGGAQTDLLEGGAGPDYLMAVDGTGFDTANGGPGGDLCVTDPGDTTSSC